MLQERLLHTENEHSEYKKAQHGFEKDTAAEYCAALANEGGGELILGVTDKVPRQVIGTSAFPDLNEIKLYLLDQLKVRVDVSELTCEGKRVLIFHAPKAPRGKAIGFKGRFRERSGEGLVNMSFERLALIAEEGTIDRSQESVTGATINDLSTSAIQRFREAWAKRSGNSSLLQVSAEQLLIDAGLLGEDQAISIAALVLLGSSSGVKRWLPQAEVILEYRSNVASIPYQAREQFREGFFEMDQRLWQAIKARTEVQQVREGMFIRDIPDFEEEVVREALLNAICHRDYANGSSVFIRQSPQLLEFESPGGFPDGITPENVLTRQHPRNRLIAEALQLCGLVERSGQGADKMFRKQIEQGKPRPDYSASDAHRVVLKLRATIQDKAFIHFLDRVGLEAQQTWTLHDLMVLDDVRSGSAKPDGSSLQRFIDQGLVQRISKGRGVRYILAKRYYQATDQEGRYTRDLGLDRETNKELLLKHLRNFGQGTMSKFMAVLPSLTRGQVSTLLKELKNDNKIHFVGVKRGGHWELGPESGSSSPQTQTETNPEA
ncbi:MAG: ATP-binding protein [Planctomycetaceae bacterium]